MQQIDAKSLFRYDLASVFVCLCVCAFDVQRYFYVFGKSSIGIAKYGFQCRCHAMNEPLLASVYIVVCQIFVWVIFVSVCNDSTRHSIWLLSSYRKCV